MKNLIVTVNGVAYNVTVEEGTGAPVAAAAPAAPVAPAPAPAADGVAPWGAADGPHGQPQQGNPMGVQPGAINPLTGQPYFG